MSNKKVNEYIESKKIELENDLFAFAKYINPTYIYGPIHEDVFRWMQGDIQYNQLLLIPRGHLKSHCLAVWALWWVTKHPYVTMVYVSATDKLATVQLFAIKQMLESQRYRLLWPEMIAERENDRAIWNKSEIMVDHPPLRKERMVRDYTIHTNPLTGEVTATEHKVYVDDITEEEVANGVRVLRDLKFAETSFAVERHREELELGIDTTLTATEYQAVLQYRQGLRDLPNRKVFPNNVVCPTHKDKV